MCRTLRAWEPDVKRLGQMIVKMAESPLWLDEADRERVTRAIEETCRIRAWDLHKVNVRTNHAHVVVSIGERAPEKAAGVLKTWATRALKESGRHSDREKFWTNQASTRWLFGHTALAKAIEYVQNQ